MNYLKTSLVFALSLYASIVFSQQELTLHLVPRYSYALTIPPTSTVIQGRGFSSSQFRTRFIGTLVDSDGLEKEIRNASDGFGLDVMMKYTNARTQNAWVALMGLYRQKFLTYSDHPIFSFKGYELGAYVNFYRTTGVSFGLRRVFGNGNKSAWFVQGNALMSLSNQRLGSRINEWNDITTGRRSNYVENGTGTTTYVLSANKTNLAVGPEIGFTGRGNVTFELSLSYNQPIGQPISTIESSYYERGRLVGTEQESSSQQSIWLNLRMPIKVWGASRTPKQRTPKPPKAEKPKPIQPPVDTTNHLANYKKNEPIKLDNVIFELSSADIMPSSYAELNLLVKLMKDRPDVEIRVEGHTDKIGNSKDNMALSKDRVKSVKDYLVNKGIKASRISVKGYGDSRPICAPPCQSNRRVEFVVTKE